ncbi:MAG: hypothetical protein ABIP81_04885 [Terriglobales bacterium]
MTIRTVRVLSFAWLVLALAAGAQTAPASTPPPLSNEETAQLIREMRVRIDNLEKKVLELEAAKVSTPPVPPPAAVPAAAPSDPTSAPAEAAIASVPDDAGHHVAPDATGNYPDLKIRGFADVVFSATNTNSPQGSRSGFSTGQFILHFASALSPKINYFGEVSMTFLPSTILVNLERSIIRYDHNDAVKVSFGQFHVPSSYYNAAYHHGHWLQTTISRPNMVDFNTGLMPQHILGASVEGNIPSKGTRLGYMAGIGNGSGGFSIGDSDNHRAWFGTLFTRPLRVYGLQVGASVYGDKRRISGKDYREYVHSVHVVYNREPYEFIAEASNVRHREVNSVPTFNSQMAFVQLGYRLPFNDGKWKPYYLFDFVNTPSTEPIYGTRDLVGSTAGVRWDISNFAAFKFEYRNRKRRMQDPRFQGFFAQTAFTF